MYKLSVGRTIQDLINADKEWQKLRDSLRGTWKEHAEENVRKLRSYLGSVQSASNEKIAIIMNYLTESGFRIGIISHPEITKLRKELSEEIKDRKKE